MTRAEINAKSDKKRGVRLQSYKLHEDVIALLSELSEQTGLSKTQIVSQGIKQIMQITIHISNQCKQSHFYDTEYAGELYEHLSSSYPLAQLKFIFTRTNYEIKAPYIVSLSTAGVDEKEVARICSEVCRLLIQKNQFRILYPATGDVLPLQFKNFKTDKEIEDYLKENGVKLSAYGYFEDFI